ncbi:MAG: glycosyltransferase [Prevotella sp.]|uniref:glycosyltransferase family 2 protein n=1 Tax=Prevotella sp. TaxID=59823 RepID=UPI0025F994E7|nr:glycosyltransferase [Prevotella sp.]MCI7118962.1 glycosyltransferase [Prevotella sp.]
MLKDIILYTYGYVVFFYSLALIASYVMLIWLAYTEQRKHHHTMSDSYVKQIFRHSPYTPGVSIVAPAYNEEKTIVNNVKSLLSQDYPKFEIVIVNDGSKDNTLQEMIDNFDLVETPYNYRMRISAKPFKRLFTSTNPKYQRLRVVDKVNGGTKADAVNGGLNVVRYPYFINTDVDCILAKDAIMKCVRPMIEMNDVIAVSGVMNMSNGSRVEDGELIEYRIPWSPIPLFQTLEYLRSFMVGKMGWSAINAMPNVSGGYGMFDTEVAIAAGGYSSDSLAEDEDMLIRMIGYCCDFNRKYRVVQIPDTCCWTEGPANLKILNRQRTRWGHGLIQTFGKYYRMMFKKKYRQLGLITMPHQFIFELLAPVIEFVGLLTTIYLAFTGGVNWGTAAIIFAVMYVFCVQLSLVVIYYDYTQTKMKGFAYLRLIVAALLEPFVYHPLIVLFSLRGYMKFITKQRIVWGEMTRQGFAKKPKQAAS